MQTFLHIGPHKTGTTSLQRCLNKQFGGDVPNGSIWYPRPVELGPGHSALAVQTLRRNVRPLREIVETAEDSGVDKLILSSETFCRAYDGWTSQLLEAIEGTRVHLVVTLNSPIRRAASMWAELVKHGHAKPIEESLPDILAKPGFKPDLTKQFIIDLQPERASVILLSKGDNPAALFERAAEVFGTELAEADTSSQVNRRLGLIETELLLALNQIVRRNAPETPGGTFRELRICLMPAISKPEWRKRVPQIEIETPLSFLPPLRPWQKRQLASLA